MYRKMLIFESPDKQTMKRVYFRDGLCKTPDSYAIVMEKENGWCLFAIKTSGNTCPPNHMKFRPRFKAPVEIPEEFLGLQVAPKVTAEPKIDEEGNLIEKRERVSLAPDMLEKIKACAASGKTLKQAEAELELPYAKLAFIAKKNDIEFVKGKKGRVGKSTPIDADVMAKIKACAESGKTLKQTESELSIPYAKLIQIAKKESLVFVKGKKGREAKEKKPIDPALLETLKQAEKDEKTLKDVMLLTGLTFFQLAPIVKQSGIVLQKGKRGRKAKV